MLKKITLKIIRAYQKIISPFWAGHCRFFPSCSEYSILAIRKYGIKRGFWLGLGRILRCQPFSRGGIDKP